MSYNMIRTKDINEYLTNCEILLSQIKTDPSLSYGDIQQKAELIKRGLDFIISDFSDQVKKINTEYLEAQK